MNDNVEIGLGRSARRGYSLDDIGIVPSRRTRDVDVVSLTWQIDAYRFRNERGGVLAAFDLDARRRFGQPILGLARAAVAEAVEREAQRQGVAIQYDKRLVVYTEAANS